MIFDISIITPSGLVGHTFLGLNFTSKSEAENWGERQARAIGEPYDFINVYEVRSVTSEELS